MKNYLILFFMILLLGNVFAAGADNIFNEIGMDKPSQWDSWSRIERFNYLENLGLSPGADGKYTGDAGDLTDYFNLLSLEEPSNWNSMSFEEKKVYVSGTVIESNIEVSSTEESSYNFDVFANVIVFVFLMIVYKLIVYVNEIFFIDFFFFNPTTLRKS